MTELHKRILNPDISAQERDLLCETSFGMPFSEAVHEIRLDDLKNGVKSRDYIILSVRCMNNEFSCEDETPLSVEIYFAFTRPYDMKFLQAMAFLYEMDLPYISANGMHSRSNAEFHTTLYGTDSYKWAVSEIRKLQNPF